MEALDGAESGEAGHPCERETGLGEQALGPAEATQPDLLEERTAECAPKPDFESATRGRNRLDHVRHLESVSHVLADVRNRLRHERVGAGERV